ncbi:MAG TPA: glycosyltransferase [Candidatus Limnocylindrales bacterium]|jgi:glycosyltransferase involved in cell wall biosynthesis|nr:glycosyltransferase [Candidatus Limnocylindrales bacterium]
MNIIQLTPGAGAMFCGNCLRDNALVRSLRAMGHDVLMVPLYLPLTLDEPDESAGTPIFFSGISVYLEQKSALFRNTPRWLNNLLASPRLLRWAAGRAAKTRAADLGGITFSMLEGELGNQAHELDLLINWLKTQPRHDVVCLSNALLIGLARRLKNELGAPIVCTLQGEDSFLDSLPEPHRSECWELLSQRAKEVDFFIAPSRYFGDLMQKRLALAPERVRVVYNGINLDGYPDQPIPAATDASARPSPALGFFARMCREKGLDTLVDAFIQIRQRGRVAALRLQVGGSCGPADQPLVESLREKLAHAGLSDAVEFCPNLDRAGKIAFLRQLSVFSVPAGYGEAFGLYVIEAMAAGVPVVQPNVAAFPELIEATGGGLISDNADAQSLAEQIEKLLLEPERARSLGERGRQSVHEKFSVEAMSRALLLEFDALSTETVKMVDR